jgi:hypothetical protein
MFKLTDLDNAERVSRVMQTLAAGINNFVLTPGEAREILQEEWADTDIDWESDFTDEERDWLQTLNVAQMGAEAALPEEMSGNPRVGQNGGGMESGTQTASEQPDGDALDGDVIDAIADRVADRLTE